MRFALPVLTALALIWTFPVAVEAGFPSPADWRNESIYQVFTDRFYDGDSGNNNADGSYDPAQGARTHGGDWEGIRQKLDYIQGLGATALWISPVLDNAYGEYHGYATRDRYSFAKQFGDIAALRAMIDDAHARGMYVILDVITNHGGDLIDSGDPGWDSYQNPGTYTLRWRNSGNKPGPPFDNLAWYHNNGGIDNFVDPNQILGELFGLDDYKTEDPAVRDALIESHQWLIDTTDADGFRIDTVKHVELGFWQEFGPALRAYAADSLGKDNFFMFGEVFDGSSFENGKFTGTQGGGAFALDATLWFPMHFTTNGVFRDGGSTEWLSGVYGDSLDYDPAARERLVKFLDNHDIARFMGFGSGADQDESKFKVGMVWLYASIGVPCLYYGSEQEFDGGGDPYNREDMWDGQWDFGPSVGDNFHQAAPLYKYTRRLHELRDALPALRTGSQEEIANSSGAGIYAFYRREAGQTTCLVILNNDGVEHTLTIDPDLPGGVIYEGITGLSRTIPGGGNVTFTIGAQSAAVWSQDDVARAPWVARTWPPHDEPLGDLAGNISITFTEAMNEASVIAALSIAPSIAYGTHWIGKTLVMTPSANLANGTRYTVTIDETASSKTGGAAGGAGATGSLGTPFSFAFDTSPYGGGVNVPAAYYASEITTGKDLITPLCLEASRPGLLDDRLLVGDTGWDRVFYHDDDGFVEMLFDYEVTGSLRPRSIALDREGGHFGGDLVIADNDAFLRGRLDADHFGSVSQIASTPSTGPDWIVAVDPSGDFGGLAYFGGPGENTVRSLDSAGAIATFATGFSSVTGLAFGRESGFGRDLYVSTGSGTIYRVDSGGGKTVFATVTGAGALVFDPVGTFDSSMLVMRSGGAIDKVTGSGAVSSFGSGFGSFPTGDCGAIDALGNFYAVADDRVVKITPLSLETDVDDPVPPPPSFALALEPNRPNPFNPFTVIDFTVPGERGRGVRAKLEVLDIQGRLVRTLVEGVVGAGEGSATWDGRNDAGDPVASGTYFVKFEAGGVEKNRKITLVR